VSGHSGQSEEQHQGRGLGEEEGANVEDIGDVAGLLEFSISGWREAGQRAAQAGGDLFICCDGLGNGEDHGAGEEEVLPVEFP